jgi:hypothetical protein
VIPEQVWDFLFHIQSKSAHRLQWFNDDKKK